MLQPATRFGQNKGPHSAVERMSAVGFELRSKVILDKEELQFIIARDAALTVSALLPRQR